jgi:hypothetical protein
MNADLLSLKLYVDDKNEVWYINNDGPPTATHATPLQFLLYPMSIEMPRIRIVGFHQNINLILALLVRQIQRGTGTIEVCSPSVCKTAADSKDPYKTLYAMRQFDRAGSMGGWHRILHGDYTSKRQMVKSQIVLVA